MQETQSVSSVTDPEVGSATTENTTEIETKPVVENKFEANSNSDHDRYKRDMLRYKEEAKKLQEQMRERELEEQKAKGDLEGALKRLEEENQTLKHDIAKDRVRNAKSRIEDEVKRVAMQKGCKDVDAFYRLIDNEDLSKVELDGESLRVNKQDAELLVEANMKKFEHIGLFGAKNVRIVDGSPGTKVDTKVEPKTEQDYISNYMKSKGWA